MRLVPVDEVPGEAPQQGPKLVPVDDAEYAKAQVAPASGVFPAVQSGTGATVPQGTFPAAPPVSPPPPSATPEVPGEPDIPTELVGSVKKGMAAFWDGRKLIQHTTGTRTLDDAELNELSTSLAGKKALAAQYPDSASSKAAAQELEDLKKRGEGGILPSLGVYARNPRFAANQFMQSAPSSLPSMATAPLGFALGGPIGLKLGLGAGSAFGDFGDAYTDYVDENFKPKTAADWKEILTNPDKHGAAARYAGIHSAVVGAGDALGPAAGGWLGGKLVGSRIANPVGNLAATSIAGAPASALIAGAAEYGGQVLGGKKEIDPGAVAGEIFLGTAGDVISTGLEVASHKEGAIAPNTPATPADVETARQAAEGIQTPTMPPPEVVPPEVPRVLINQPAAEEPPVQPAPVASELGGIIRPAPETPTFYSPTRRYIEQKGPGAATAEQWWNTLQNAPGVKREELSDIGMPAFLDREGKITKKEMLDFLDENAIQLEERIHTKVDPIEIDSTQKRILREMNMVAAANPDTRDATGAMITSHPLLAPLWQQYEAARQARAQNPQYEGYTLPGERNGYAELVMHLPARDTVQEVAAPQGWGDTEGGNIGLERTGNRDFTGGHYTQPNVVTTARVTERASIDGVPTALIEEIQSDAHQLGRKQGYRQEVPNPGNWVQFMAGKGYTRQQALEKWNMRFHPEDVALHNEHVNQVEAFNRDQQAVPDLPFKQSWDELAFKRVLRWAADKGYRRIAWVNAAEQMRRYPAHPLQPEGGARRVAGMEKFYNQILPSVAKKWAKYYGGMLGEMVINTAPTDAALVAGHYDLDAPHEQVVQYIELPKAAIERIQAGLPLYSDVNNGKRTRPRKKGGATLDELAAPATNTFGKQFVPALNELIQRLGLGIDIALKFHAGAIVINVDGRNRTFNSLGVLDQRRWTTAEGKPGKLAPGTTIHISMLYHKTAAEVWATIVHEVGHAVFFQKYADAPAHTRIAIKAAFDDFLANTPTNSTLTALLQRRDNAVIALLETRGRETGQLIANMTPSERQYWTHFEEWFAEQVARWGTSQEKPVGTVNKFFKGLGQILRDLFEGAAKKFNLPFEPAKAMNDWLNSMYTDMPPFAKDVDTQTDIETQGQNQEKMEEGEKAVPRQPETVPTRERVDAIFGGRPPREVQEVLAAADKWSWWYKMGLGIHQLAARNPHIAALAAYVERIAVAQLTKQQIMIRAQEVLKKWNGLGMAMADNVAGLIDDVNNMVYRTPDEVKKGVKRFPNNQEMADLIKKHGVSQEGIAVFKEIADTFNEHLTRYEAVLRKEAMKTTDAKKQADRLKAITTQIANLRSVPYFPSMRFGDYTITVRNAARQVVYFETFEWERTRNNAVKELQAKYGFTQDQVQVGKLDRTARPLLGVPTQLLELMSTKLELNKKQRDALEQLKFELSPAQSFKHRFQHKQRVAGYSQDFRRAYANYFFHGANHLMKAMYADEMRGLIKVAKDEVRDAADITHRNEITAFMNDHVEAWLDPKPDWHAIRSMAFLLHLAFVPAAATQNLTQTLMTTYPHLAAQFGDLKAIGAILNAQRQISTWYKKGTLQNPSQTDFQLKALGRMIQQGLINEAMAPELAGYAEGGNLLHGFGGTDLQRQLHKFNELGAKMFEMAEQMNRRTVARATLDLAMKNPNAKYVKDMVKKHRLQYDQLKFEGYTDEQAAAYVTAHDATVETQFQYGKDYQPRLFRGRQRSIFVFKTFIHSYVMWLSNYPRAAVRSMLILGFLGGLSALPGFEDLRELLKALAWQIFGKDLDLEKEGRKLIIQMTGQDERGRVAGDIALHGVSKYGYGIPHVMEMIGSTVGMDIRLPTFDRSKAISAGTILPVELGKIFGPQTQDADSVISQQSQKASGAVFGMGFNVYKALRNENPSIAGWKNWEKALPRAISDLSKAYRYGSNAKETNSKGDTIVKYDVRDTQQLMEVIGTAMGYTPAVQAQYWDRTMAAQEAIKRFDIERTGLMKQMGNAVQAKDAKEVAEVKEAIKKFNLSLPKEAAGKAISSDSLRSSIETQIRGRVAREAELSVKRSDIPILQEVKKLYPSSTATSVRRAPRGSQP